MENQDSGLFALGLLSSNLEELGIETAIEKYANPNEQKNDLIIIEDIINTAESYSMVLPALDGMTL